MADWNPSSWQNKQVQQQPNYPSPSEVNEVVLQLSQLPPLVTSWEVENLKTQLAEAAAGKRFLLQGGDCAERFADCNPENITNKLKILLQMSLVLVHGLKQSVIRIGRFGGQYAKPRSSYEETQDGIVLPSYRGDLVNGSEFTSGARRPDPQRMLRGYGYAALTLNYVRSLMEGGFADLHHPENWDLGFMDHAASAQTYRKITSDIGQSIRFMEAIRGAHEESFHRVDFFASHEGLLLPYEQAQTRQVPNRSGWYNLAAHMPWIGARTLDLDGAHVEYFRGIRNPIALKIGPSITSDELTDLIDCLDSEREPGRLTLIHRFGADEIESSLPPLIETVNKMGYRPLWVCDPMHGNTVSTESGIKTRHFDHILAELQRAFSIHQELGSRLGGVHFELTGENVTECVGGARGLSEQDLLQNYRSEVDPRLNYEQALEMAMLIVTIAES